MKYGFIVPPSAMFDIARFAVEAEKAGWDGIFVAHAMWGTDTMLCLTVAATHTEHIRLGTMLTPLSTMRPWKLAMEVATLDRLPPPLNPTPHRPVRAPPADCALFDRPVHRCPTFRR